MPWFAFEETTLLDCEAHETREALEQAFSEAAPTAFEIDRAEYDRAFYSFEEPRAIYFTSNALHSNFLIQEGDTFKLGSPSDLYQIIDASEDESDNHIVFYPDCYHAKRWQRSDDEIDLALMFYWEKGGTRQTEIDGSPRVQYVEYGHGPWKNSLMTEDGTPLEWLFSSELRERPDLVPRVPLEMRWYLKRLGILDDQGVNKLRPLTARWIS